MELYDKIQLTLHSLAGFLPETFLAFAFFVILGIELYLYKRPANQTNTQVLYWLTMLVMLFVFRMILQEQALTDVGLLFADMVILDGLGIFFKAFIVLAAIILLLHAYLLKSNLATEFFPMLIGMTLGLCLMCMATNLLMMYVGIEMVSLCSYIFTAFRKDKQGSEAGLKYALFGAAASAVMLYGMSWIYGITGTLSLADSAFGRDLFANTDSPMTLLACAFTLGGFLFKLASVPFHLWTPDTYQASPTPLVSFFSVAPKMAALALAIRFVIVAQVQLQTLLVYVCIATLAVGNFTALWQTNAKRLLAYSSIAQAGFMLIGLVAMGALGIKSLLFYMATYLFMSMLAFLLIDICFDDKAQAADMAGFGRRHPFWAVLFTLAMVALAGLPPTVGFTAKFLAFSSLWDSYVKSQQTLFVVLFAFGLFNMVVSLFYYLKIPYIMFFKESPDSEPFINPTLGQKVLSITLAIPILYLFFDVNFLMKWITVLLER